MKIPKGEDAQSLYDRDQLYDETIQICFASHEKRKGQYDLLKSYYLYGCAPEWGATPYNKIMSTVDTLTSFLYSADTTRFTCELPINSPADEWDKVPLVSKTVNEEWQASHGDNAFGLGLEMALVFNSTLIKIIVKDGHIAPYIVEPQCVGVYREDVNYIDRQEAIAHRYYITRSQLESDLSAHPRRADILSRLKAKPREQDDQMPDGLKRIIVTNLSGAPPLTPGGVIKGNAVNWLDGRVEYVPYTSADLIEMVELWIWNDDENDYQVVTRADGLVTIYDRKNFFLDREHPFGHICPDPMLGYFWGRSFAGSLIGLQQYLIERMDQVRDLLAKQVNPPTALEGFTGAIDEMEFALNKASGVFPMSDPMAKVHRFAPQIPEDVYADVRFLIEAFAEASGLQNLLMGRGETGVRSGRQTSELARLGSARVKKRALLIEDSLDAIVTKYFKAQRKYNATKLYLEKDGKQEPFSLDQIDEEAVFRVDAHSNSPLFVEDQKSLAGELFEARAISRARLIEMTNPPGKQVILRELKEIEKKEAAAALAQQQAQAAGIKTKEK